MRRVGKDLLGTSQTPFIKNKNNQRQLGAPARADRLCVDVKVHHTNSSNIQQ